MKPKFKLGELVVNIGGARREGRIVGTFRTPGVEDGYVVENLYRRDSVLVFSANELELLPDGLQAEPKFDIGDYVYKTKGSRWSGTVVGTYSTKLTPEGYAVESDSHAGSVQIYPAAALEKVPASSWSDPRGR